LLLADGDTVQWMNSAAEALLGASRRNTLGKSLHDVAGLPQSLIAHFDDARRQSTTLVEREANIERRSGPPAIVDCMITPIPAEHHPGSVELLIEIFDNDRQNRIASEQQLLEQQRQSQTLLRSLAHEILNPLGGIRGAAQLLEQDTADTDLREYTQLIIREADRLKNLLRRVLGPSAPLQMQPHNVHDVIEHVTRLLLTDAPKIDCRHDYDPSIPEIICDRESMIQVLINIVANAVRAVASTEQAAITIRTRVERNFTIRNRLVKLVCRIQIIDNGPGVDPQISETLFYPLVTASEGGTGLGLSIAQSLVIQHGGLIECQSVPGNTVFTITVPI
jgi:two-component system nitrogen regulation sensor histidine kinase GlnL